MAYSQEEDRLTAVVLHALLNTEPEAKLLTLAELVRACERNPELSADSEAVQAALESLLSDGLAVRVDDRFQPTRAAIRAHQLSF